MTIKFNVLNRFSGDIQFSATIDCAKDALTSIKLGLAVRWAIESGAYLSGADLSGANLSGAEISTLATLGSPNGWSAFTYITEAGEQRVQVGCHNKTLAEGRTYWANKADRREVLAALDYAEAIARIRQWAAVPATQAVE